MSYGATGVQLQVFGAGVREFHRDLDLTGCRYMLLHGLGILCMSWLASVTCMARMGLTLEQFNHHLCGCFGVSEHTKPDFIILHVGSHFLIGNTARDIVHLFGQKHLEGHRDLSSFTRLSCGL